MLKINIPRSMRSLLAFRTGSLIAVLSFSPSLGLAIVAGTETFTVPDESLVSGASAGPAGATVSDVLGWDFTVFSESPDALASFDIWNGTVGSGNGVAFYETNYTEDFDMNFNALRISPTDGSLFDLEGVGLNLQLWNGTAVVNNQNATLQGLNADGNAIAGATLTLAVNDGFLIDFDTSAITQFQQISAFQVTPSSGSYVMAYGFVDNISVIPEPSSIAAIIGAGAIFVTVLRRRKSR